MQVASLASLASLVSPQPLPRSAFAYVPGRLVVASIDSLGRLLGTAVRLSSELQHLGARQQGDVARAWLHDSAWER